MTSNVNPAPAEARVPDPGAPLGLESMQAGTDIPIAESARTMEPTAAAADSARRTRANRRVGWTLLSLCVVFFAGIILARLSGDTRVGLMVLGVAITLFLLVAIGRNLRK